MMKLTSRRVSARRWVEPNTRCTTATKDGREPPEPCRPLSLLNYLCHHRRHNHRRSQDAGSGSLEIVSRQVRIDTAVEPQRIDPATGAYQGSSPIERMYAVRIPKGTTVYNGPVANQGGVYVGGSSVVQTFIDQPWKIPGVEVLESWPVK